MTRGKVDGDTWLTWIGKDGGSGSCGGGIMMECTVLEWSEYGAQ